MSSSLLEVRSPTPSAPRGSLLSRHAYLLTLLAIALALGCLVYPPLPVLTLMADTDQYRAMSASLLDGSFLDAVDLKKATHLATIMRPPLFPLLLAAASIVPGLAPSEALIALHLCLAVAILVASPILLRAIIPPPLTAMACGFALLSAKQIFWGEMSEWLAMSCLLTSTALYVLWLTTKSATSAFATSFLISLAILTRSALIPWLFLPIILFAQAPRVARFTTGIAILTGVLPLVLWGGIQVHRLGSFTLGAYEGLNVLATARSLGDIPLNASDLSASTLVLSRLNERGVTVSDDGLRSEVVHEWDGEFYDTFHHNFDEVCAAVQEIAPGEPFPALRVAARAFFAQASRYRLFLKGGLETLTRECAPLLLTCLGTGLWLLYRYPGSRALACASITVSFVATIYTVSIFTSILWLHRYVSPIQGPLLFLTLLSLFDLLTNARGD